MPMPTAANRISTGYSARCSLSRSNQPCAAMIATAAAGKMIALPKLAKMSAANRPSKHRTGVRRRTDQRDGRGEQQRDGEPADERGPRRRRPRPRPASGRSPPIDRITSGRSGSEAAHQCVRLRGRHAPVRRALPSVRCESPAGAARSIRASSRPTSARIGAQEAFGIDAHPEAPRARSAPSSHHSRSVEVGHRRGFGVRAACRSDPPVEPEHVGGAEDDAGGRDDRAPSSTRDRRRPGSGTRRRSRWCPAGRREAMVKTMNSKA